MGFFYVILEDPVYIFSKSHVNTAGQTIH